MRLWLALAFALCTPSLAFGWTEAQVETLEATVNVRDPSQLHVSVELDLHVSGGWLESLEVAGFDEGLVLEEDSVRFIEVGGGARTPRVRQRRGRLTFTFPRRGAPRRGDYRVRFAYTAPALEADDSGTLSWTLPGWRTGLDGVVIHTVGDASLEFAEAVGGSVTIARQRSENAGEATLRWQRAHLPRTVPWTVRFRTTQGAEASQLEQAATTSPTHARADDAPAPPKAPGWLFAVLAVLGALFAWLFEGRARRYRSRARPLLPLPLALRVFLLFGWAFAAAHAGPAIAAVGMASLLWQRTGAPPSAPRLGGWRAARAGERSDHAPRPWDSWTDGRSFWGMALALGTVAFAYSKSGDPFSLVLALPWLATHGGLLPAGLEEKRRRLLRFAAGLRIDQVALRFAVHEDADGVAQDLRLRLHTGVRRAGLHRFDAVVAEGCGAGGLHAQIGIVVVVREGTSAAGWMATHYTRSEAIPGGRVAYLLDPQELPALVRGLACTESKQAATPRPAPRRVQQRPTMRH